MAGTNPGTVSLLGLGVDIKGIAEATNLSVNTDPPQKGPLYSAAGLLDGKAWQAASLGHQAAPIHPPSAILLCAHMLHRRVREALGVQRHPHSCSTPSTSLSTISPTDVRAVLQRAGLLPLPILLSEKEQGGGVCPALIPLLSLLDWKAG